jgi:hypothetical protein
MSHSDRFDPLAAQRGSFGRPEAQVGGGDGAAAHRQGLAFQRPVGETVSHPEGLTPMRAELREILGMRATAAEALDDEAAQVRRAFLRSELARIDAA